MTFGASVFWGSWVGPLSPLRDVRCRGAYNVCVSFWEDENFDPFEETLSDLSHEEYSFWAKCDLWTLEEAAYIVNGNTPRNQDWFDEQAQAAASEQVARGEPPLDEPVFVPTDSHGNPVGQCYHLSLKAAETKKLRVTESGVAPQDYVDWIRSKGFGIPDANFPDSTLVGEASPRLTSLSLFLPTL